MKVFVYLIFTLIIYNFNVSDIFAGPTVIINKNTTIDDIYRQSGAKFYPPDYSSFATWSGDDGKFHSSSDCVTYVYTTPSTVIITYHNNKKYEICNRGCEFSYLYILYCPDKERSSTLSNLFPGLFDQE